MKGIVFNLLEEVVQKTHGEDVWDDLLEAAGLDGVYTSLGTYDHRDLVKLVGAASSALNLPAQDVIRWFGKNALPLFAERYPVFFDTHTSTRSFLLTLNDVIHPEVRKLYPDADVPEFDFETPSDDVLILGYYSENKLCAFAEGLIEGAAEHFEERVVIEQPQCMVRGDDKCLLHISFEKLTASQK